MDKYASLLKGRLGFWARLLSGSWRELLVVAVPALLVLGLFVWAGVRYVRLAPSHAIRLISGPEGSTYRTTAEKYKKIIEKRGVKVEILPSHGSYDNLHLLANRSFKADLAFVQGGLTDGVDISDLVSLGTVFVQPLMVYYRGSEPIDIIAQFAASGWQWAPKAAARTP